MKNVLPSSSSSHEKKDECLKKISKNKENINLKKCEKKERCNSKSKTGKLTKQNSIVRGEKRKIKKQIKIRNSASNDFARESFEEEMDEDYEEEVEEDEDEDRDKDTDDARKYFKEGQKIITPPNGDGTRAFYESLLEENPNSIIAIKYCIEHGVLSGTKHHEALYKYCVLKKNNAFKNNFGGLSYRFVKLLEESCKSEKYYNKDLLKKEVLSK
ncbi:hypothetical protein MKS88_004763 [Plasmodium brasilianum]|uniref:Uncharacterized protein n=1 Tax=Plasmodium brasilianum TaxID=5824 RepID=A0ACB9Y2D2_PLABR|nr:hypothetical protein MKS88_004763 [Plasmodium brasilianum]